MTPTRAPAAATASAAAPAGFLRRHAIWFAAALALLVAVGIVMLTHDEGGYDDPLDPQGFGPEGARAVAQVLEEQGVDVVIARSAAEFEDARIDRRTTVVVTGSERLVPSTTERLLAHASPGRLVLPAPSLALLREVSDDPSRAVVRAEDLPADCPTYDGLELTVESAHGWNADLAGCFVSGGRPILADTGVAVLFGAAEALTNDQVLRGDNAAIALRLLGQHDRLVWYVPTWADAEEDDTAGLGDLLPDWVVPGLWLGLAAGLALVLWRARRLGPLAKEPLPVVVRAIETARSRGRMYHHGRDRDHAAAALRRAARRRAAERLRLGRDADETAVVAAVAHHLDRDHAAVRGLIGSDAPPPTTDEALVALADALARFEREVASR